MQRTLNIFPVKTGNSSFLAQTNLIFPEGSQGFSPSSGVETIILLDVSGSMGQNVQRIFNNYLPSALEKAGFGLNEQITIVTFSDKANIYNHTINSLRNSTQRTEGSTYMSYGVKAVDIVMSGSKYKKFRLLSLSDGELNDRHESVNEADRLSQKIRNNKWVVSSNVIRFFTSSAQPDTRGLSAMLKLDTKGAANDNFVLDISASSNTNEIIQRFADSLTDNLGSSCKIVSDESVFLETPWGNPSTELTLLSGQNTFWLTKVPNVITIVNKTSNGNLNETIEIVEGKSLNFNCFNTILKDKVDYFMQRLKILKVVNSADAKAEVDSIVSYFQQLEKLFSLNDNPVDVMNNHGLQTRLAFFRDLAQKKSRSVSIQMSAIANDDKVNQLNSAQQANYLRSANVSSNAKNLAKRAIVSGLNFNEIAHKEVKEMKKHLHELDNIDDSGHYVSFYSLETTLQGIKTVCALDDADNTLENSSALEILQLLNIVGIPCKGPVGDFPDPKTYHFDELMLGTFVSLSDVLMVKDSGHILRDPVAENEDGTKKEIINVVPFYDDDRIQQFLMKYAPTLLEYTASLGMRNMILDVPHSYKYTIVGGVWNMAMRLDKEKTSVNADIFVKLVHTYKTAVDGLFDKVVPLIKEQSDEDKKNALSFFIQNNGITNMISPLITIIEGHTLNKTHGERAGFIPDILRALFSFEFYQSTRKLYKSDSDKIEKRKEFLNKLLGINFDKHATSIPAHFEPPLASPQHYNKPDVDQKLFNDILKRVFWLDHCASLPRLIAESFKDNGKENIMKLPSICEKHVMEALNITHLPDLTTFKLYCVVQSFLFDTKAARVDVGKMKIHDCGNQKIMEQMISEYIEKQYRAHYQSELSKKEKEERSMLVDELVLKLCQTQDIEEFKNLLRTGYQRNHVKVSIHDQFALGFMALRDSLFNKDIDVPLRHKKCKIFVLGTDMDEIVWNKGNVVKMSLLTLNELFSNVGLSDLWNSIYETYKAKNIYLYRESDKPNRHTHCNSKSSFWAYGYSTVGKYFAEITEQERNEYMKIHTHCCGIWDGKLVKLA